MLVSHVASLSPDHPSISPQVEGIALDEESLSYLGEIGEETSLRHAVQASGVFWALYGRLTAGCFCARQSASVQLLMNMTANRPSSRPSSRPSNWLLSCFSS